MTKPLKLRDKIADEDKRQVAEELVKEWRARKDRRKKLGIDDLWDEVDRQIKMRPELSHKQDRYGRAVEGLEWLPESETPIQSQSLEMLMADCRRLKFPKNREWFTARAAMNEKYLEKYRNAESPIADDKGENQTELQQDEADRIAAAVISHIHSQYDFRGAMDKIDAAAFKYGYGVGRLRMVRNKMLGASTNSEKREVKTPVLVPVNTRDVFLDDNADAVKHEGEVVGPNHIIYSTKKLADLKASAETDETYIAEEIDRLMADKEGLVDTVELEGDLVYESSEAVIVHRNVCVTAAVGRGDGKKDIYGLVRIQEGLDDSSYFIQFYQQEDTDSPYSTSPLMKGAPIARVIAQILNRLMESAQLKNAPPLGYNRDDPAFAVSGGPSIEPYAKWETTDEVNVYDRVGGDPGALFSIYQGLVSMYYDAVGVTPARLGATTKSHTTAFAKDAELSRGESRTVDYVNSCLEGPMTRLLYMEYRLATKNWKKSTVYIPAWNEFAEFEKAHLPDTVHWIAAGAGSPAEDEARQQRRFNAAQSAIQLDSIAVQSGRPPSIDVAALITHILEDGGWTDPDVILLPQGAGQAPTEPAQGQLPGLATAAPESLT